MKEWEREGVRGLGMQGQGGRGRMGGRGGYQQYRQGYQPYAAGWQTYHAHGGYAQQHPMPFAPMYGGRGGGMGRGLLPLGVQGAGILKKPVGPPQGPLMHGRGHQRGPRGGRGGRGGCNIIHHHHHHHPPLVNQPNKRTHNFFKP